MYNIVYGSYMCKTKQNRTKSQCKIAKHIITSYTVLAKNNYHTFIIIVVSETAQI